MHYSFPFVFAITIYIFSLVREFKKCILFCISQMLKCQALIAQALLFNFVFLQLSLFFKKTFFL